MRLKNIYPSLRVRLTNSSLAVEGIRALFRAKLTFAFSNNRGDCFKFLSTIKAVMLNPVFPHAYIIAQILVGNKRSTITITQCNCALAPAKLPADAKLAPEVKPGI